MSASIAVKGCADCPFRAYKDRGWGDEIDVCAASSDRDLELGDRRRRKIEPAFAPDWCPANGEGVTVIRTKPKPSALSKIVSGYVSRTAFDPRPARVTEHPDPGAGDDGWADVWRDLDQDIPF